MKKVIRILLSPLVFLLCLGAMTLFLGPLCLMMGIVESIYQYLKEKPGEIPGIEFTFVWIIYPALSTQSFIKKGKLI